MFAFGRHLSAQILTHNHRHFLIDCGEGTQYQLVKFRYRLKRLDAIFISHLHGDHVLGLAGLLSTLSLMSRTHRLRVFGPVGIADLIESQRHLTHSTFNYEIEFHELNSTLIGQVIYETDTLTVSPLPLSHRVPCYGYLFAEKPRAPRFLVEKAHRNQIPKEYYHLLKLGNDLTLAEDWHIRGADYLGDAPPSYSFAYCSDTRYQPGLVPFLKDVSLLYHEATFLNALQYQAEATAHSTASQAATIARDANAGHLLLGHFSARYSDLNPHLEESQPIFPLTSLAKEGRLYPIPYDPDLHADLPSDSETVDDYESEHEFEDDDTDDDTDDEIEDTTDTFIK